MVRPLGIALQACAYALFAGSIGYLSASPAYQHADPEMASISLVVNHATARVGECRQLSQEELAELAMNMRKVDECPRERHDLFIELSLDGEPLFSGSQRPTGLWRDGPSNIYRKFSVEPGQHRIVMRLRDSGRESGFDHEKTEDVDLAPRQIHVVNFREAP